MINYKDVADALSHGVFSIQTNREPYRLEGTVYTQYVPAVSFVEFDSPHSGVSYSNFEVSQTIYSLVEELAALRNVRKENEQLKSLLKSLL